MKLIHLAAAAVNQTPLDWQANTANILAAIAEARARGAALVCLPELCITGYGCEDAFLSKGVHETAAEVLREILPASGGMAVAVGLPWMHGGAVYNTSALLVDGRLAGAAVKQHLAGDGLHYEPRWFKPWPSGVVIGATLAGQTCPVGDLVFDFQGVRLGFEICEDAWVADRPGTDQAKLGVDIILNPSASHFAFGKAHTRAQLVAEASRSLGASYVYSNLLGNEAGRVIYDGHTMIAANGGLAAVGRRLSFRLVELTDAVVDVDSTRMRRARSASYEPEIEPEAGRIVEVGFDLQGSQRASNRRPAGEWEESAHLKEEEFTRAVALALHDYLRKSGCRGFVVSLSGGADSTASACLVALMVKLAVHDLGLEAFCRRLGVDCSDPGGVDRLTESLLTTVYQATRNSSETTRSSARVVAESLPARHLELDVDDICQLYTTKIESALGKKFDWGKDDLTLQNIQARVRGPAAWMIANSENALLLATSNRSEAAVGYATMDGDTCGGISPIAGIDKAFLCHWLRWLETAGPSEAGPLESLKLVNQLVPTAELRPLESEQNDEDDLMPYEVLDAIEDHAIGEKRYPQEVLDMVAVEFEHYPRQRLAEWTAKFFDLWSRNQWKRERYAPSFHVDDKNLDPKTWCRFPILSGGFRRELSQLDLTEPT